MMIRGQTSGNGAGIGYADSLMASLGGRITVSNDVTVLEAYGLAPAVEGEHCGVVAEMVIPICWEMEVGDRVGNIIN